MDDSYAGMLGLSAAQKEDLIGTKMSDIIHPGDLERVVKETLLSLQGTGKYVCKYRMKTAEEEYKWVWEMGERFYDEDQEYIQGTVVDIDEKETNMCINERKVLKNNAISPIYAQNYAGFKISFLSYARCSGWGYKRPWSPR